MLVNWLWIGLGLVLSSRVFGYYSHRAFTKAYIRSNINLDRSNIKKVSNGMTVSNTAEPILSNWRIDHLNTTTFCNVELNCANLEAIGFDMDYTLAQVWNLLCSNYPISDENKRYLVQRSI